MKERLGGKYLMRIGFILIGIGLAAFSVHKIKMEESAATETHIIKYDGHGEVISKTIQYDGSTNINLFFIFVLFSVLFGAMGMAVSLIVEGIFIDGLFKHEEGEGWGQPLERPITPTPRDES